MIKASSHRWVKFLDKCFSYTFVIVKVRSKYVLLVRRNFYHLSVFEEKNIIVLPLTALFVNEKNVLQINCFMLEGMSSVFSSCRRPIVLGSM